MNIKTVICVMTIFFSMQSNAQLDGPPLPPGGPIDFCQMLPCLGGCPPVAMCHQKTMGAGLLVKPQSGIVIEDGVLNYIASSSKSTESMSIDMYTGAVTFLTFSSEYKGEDQFSMPAFNEKMVHFFGKMGRFIIDDQVDLSQKAGGCGSAGAALISAVGGLITANATGNQALIDAAWNMVETAFDNLFYECHQL